MSTETDQIEIAATKNVPDFSPLSLKEHFLTEICLKASQDRKAKGDVDVECELQFRYSKTDPRLWRVDLKVYLGQKGPNPVPITGHIEVHGIFQVSKERNFEHALDIVAQACPNILWGVAREAICNFSSRTPQNMLTLPLVTFANYSLQATSDLLSEVKVWDDRNFGGSSC